MLELRAARPGITKQDAVAVLTERWGVAGEVFDLPGEADRNFRVRTQNGRGYVLKFTAGHDDRAVLDLQDAALTHLGASPSGSLVPRAVQSPSGETIVEHGAAGARYFVRLFAWLRGVPLAEWRPHSRALLREVGETLGLITTTLTEFRHPAAHRPLKWDLAQAGWLRGHLSHVADPARRAVIARVCDEYDATVAPALLGLRRSIVHNDGNDYNVLIDTGERGTSRVSGLIDFGDLIETNTICDVAIALAYIMMGKLDPVGAGATVLRGYHAACPLEEREVDVLLPLVRTRLAVSAVNAAMQAAMAPDNDYLQVSAAGAWTLLGRLEQEHPREVLYRFRNACGWPACPSSAVVSEWIAARRGTFAPVTDVPMSAPEALVLDYSVTSPQIGTLDVWLDQARFGAHTRAVVEAAGARAGIARYDEVRAIYARDLFRVSGDDGPEWRAVHLGVDIDLPVGAAVYAPLAGTVHSVRDNTAPGDYGPTVVLAHEPPDGPAFWTLYGHLAREVLDRLTPGAALQAGDLVGHVGDRDVNGGWWPHVHVQVMCDMLGRSGDFPGVSTAAERDVWTSISPDPSPLLGAPAEARAPRLPSVDSMLGRRARAASSALSVSYDDPLHIVRGMMQHLIDADGRRYLDCVNNVAHVGHEQPDVVRAGQRQMAVLNTNTRYLHEGLLAYLEALSATLPERLSVGFLVCSGSEANELALRLARAHTQTRDVIVVEAGYHGNTAATIDVSSYKFDGPGGSGAPDGVHVVPMPDAYRGLVRDTTGDAGVKYAQTVREAVATIAGMGRRPAAFLCESILSCGGQVVLPPGYLAEAYRHVRAAGAVCIADEVQVGLGRVGSHMWAFETQDVVPDIVTMGKPLGNGHPIGAVFTTPAIAGSFANGMEYFNTFGGNPVSCAIGLEVLAVLRREGLQAHAQSVGAYLMDRLRTIGDDHDVVGDVRGLGLFIGVELVSDHVARTPAARQARYIANRLRDLGVLVSTDGPDNNVLKIKPPLCFTERDADTLVDALAQVLHENPAAPRQQRRRAR